MAEAVAPWTGGRRKAALLVRYRGGVAAIEDRYHFCIPDWLEYPWPVRDASEAVAGKAARVLERQIDRAALVASRGGVSSDAVETVRTPYLPRAAVLASLPRIPSGSIAIFVLSRPGIVSGHLGFVFRHRGSLVLRHASQLRRQVVDEPLTSYVRRAPRRFVGMKILVPDPAGLRRQPPPRGG
jgi:hypothetical protein